jgi:hypothetical protein
MKFLLITAILVHFLIGCASFDFNSSLHKSGNVSAKKDPKLSGPSAKGAVWELLSGNQLSLHLKSVDGQAQSSLILRERISTHPISYGHWELSGFELDGKSYFSMNTSKKFILRVRPGPLTYAGSIVIGCPRISQAENKHLKKMKFFNRYPFSSKDGLCEVVVGNNQKEVISLLRKTHKNDNLKIKIGF